MWFPGKQYTELQCQLFYLSSKTYISIIFVIIEYLAEKSIKVGYIIIDTERYSGYLGSVHTATVSTNWGKGQ
jgi:hypothetical protein